MYFILLIVFIFNMYNLSPEAAEPDLYSSELSEAVSEIERIDNLRSSLAEAFRSQGMPADQEAFNRVCKPVGIAMRDVAYQRGWKIIQMSEKFRNPSNKPDSEAKKVLKYMERDRTLKGQWSVAESDGATGIRYFRRITVEDPCLACHGSKDERPQFIEEGYPDDRAFGFNPGDLRGVYSVFIPKEQQRK